MTRRAFRFRAPSRLPTCAFLCASGLLWASAAAAQDAPLFNTAKQKLLDGGAIVGGTVTSPDPDSYCAMANAGFDFLWIEMQHSPMSWQDVARMIWACRGAPAVPFVRVPDATEGDIQKATDIGALGIIVPMVKTAEKMERAVRWAKYPPLGERSQGGGQYGRLWGRDYRARANDNIMVIAMIESPAGAEVADQIAAVPGVDAVFAAATDIGSFSGLRQGDPGYEAIIDQIRDRTLGAGSRTGWPVGMAKQEGLPPLPGARDRFSHPPGRRAAADRARLRHRSDRRRRRELAEIAGCRPRCGRQPVSRTVPFAVQVAQGQLAKALVSVTAGAGVPCWLT